MERKYTIIDKAKIHLKSWQYKVYEYLVNKGIGGDKLYLKVQFNRYLGQYLNLDNPKTFNQKLQWLKLYYRDPKLTMMVDKYAVKQYVSERIGDKYIIPCLGVWDTFDDIDFNKLPNQFVLKCTHDSGSYYICKDKKDIEIDFLKQKYKKHLATSHYKRFREWPYKNVKPRIIAEPYISSFNAPDLVDYKFYCFSGVPKLVLVVSGRPHKTRYTYFDENWNVLDLKWGALPHDICPSRPNSLKEMLGISSNLSVGLPHVRVDLYCVENHVFFGELTFFDAAGYEKFEDEAWDYKLGSFIDLPSKKIYDKLS